MVPADKDCIARCLAGQSDEYRHLVQRYQGPVLAYLAGRLGDRHDAEEAAQEAFVRAYCSLRRLRKPESFFSWLLGIAQRVAQEYQRDHRRQRKLAQAAGEIVAARPEESAERNDALRAAVADLPDEYRQLVLLRYYGNLTCAQMAERLEMPLGTVTKMLSRAYAMLRQLLDHDTAARAFPERRCAP